MSVVRYCSGARERKISYILGAKQQAPKAPGPRRRRRRGGRYGEGLSPPHPTKGSGGASWAPQRPLKVFLPFCATRLPLLATQYTLAAVCWAVYAYMIATDFHDTPYIHLGAPYVLGWHGPWGPVPTPPMRLCIYSPLFRHTACFSVIP